MKLETICVSCMEDDSGSPVCPKCGSPFNLPVNNLLLLPPRTTLHEQYLIGRALGHGGFGITSLAWDIGLETDVPGEVGDAKAAVAYGARGQALLGQGGRRGGPEG